MSRILRWVSALVLGVMVGGCAITTLHPADQAKLDQRLPPSVRVGDRTLLVEQPVEAVAGVITQEGRLHVFAIDSTKVIHHIEVDGENVIAREQLGTFEDGFWRAALEAIEWPPGTLRVLAGRLQFVRVRGEAWRTLEGNRCVSFVVAKERLFCAFIASGEEFGTPTRLDVHVGIVFWIPLILPMQVQSRKLVIAEAMGEAWIVRAVVDAHDALSATDLVIGADVNGNFHAFYTAAKGGSGFIVMPLEVRGQGPVPELRYVRLSAGKLSATLPNREAKAPKDVYALPEGARLRYPSFVLVGSEGLLMPLHMRFAVDPTSGAIEGLIGLNVFNARLSGYKENFWFKDGGLIDVRLYDWQWSDPVEVALLGRWPEEDVSYQAGGLAPYFDRFPGPLLHFDANGTLHAVVRHCVGCVTWGGEARAGLSYLEKNSSGWLRPVKLDADNPRRLAGPIVGNGKVYIVWSEQDRYGRDRGLFGRWIWSEKDPSLLKQGSESSFR